MNIEFIKWMVGYADSWEYKEGQFGFEIYVNGKYIGELGKKIGHSLHDDLWDVIGYPLLLQRAIEGIEEKLKLEVLTYKNKRNSGYMSQVFRSESEDDFPQLEKWFEGFETIDEAKEAALKYIYEQETT